MPEKDLDLPEYMNCSRYSLKLPDDGHWGSVKADGSWSGMVGEVARYVSVRRNYLTFVVPNFDPLYFF